MAADPGSNTGHLATTPDRRRLAGVTKLTNQAIRRTLTAAGASPDTFNIYKTGDVYAVYAVAPADHTTWQGALQTKGWKVTPFDDGDYEIVAP